jgi:hypothetical protein
MRVLRNYISLLILLAFTVATAPGALLHELHHSDTSDVHYSDADSRIGALHHHCDALQLSLPCFCHTPFAIHFSSFRPVIVLTFPVNDRSVPGILNCNFLRGPPAC